MSRTRHPAVDAVAALIRVRPDTIDTDTGPVHVQRPCLLAMLINLRYASTSGRGARGGGAGTMPLNSQALTLLHEIEYDTHSWAQLLAVPTAQYLKPSTVRPGKPATPPIGKLLRAVAHEAIRVGRDPVADAIAGLARSWANRIEDMLAEEPEQRDVRGAACPDCAATTVREELEDRDVRPDGRDDGLGWFHTPAVALVMPRDDDQQPALYCRACGAQWPLAALAEHIAGIRALLVASSATSPDDHSVDDEAGQAA